MPGLLRGVARTAVIAGTATHVSNNVSRRQARRWGAQEEQQQAPEAPVEQVVAPATAGDPMEELKQLGQLHDSGILTDDEFASKKAEILQRI